ncbi:MAG: spore cortex-lytic protein [Clostridia bacterium]|jgi:N-acetylmuramoyl-L-alanine amidase|nr:spore cortex-lytic protein [Clostridia bacterium]
MKKLVATLLICFYGIGGLLGLWLFFDENLKNGNEHRIVATEAETIKKDLSEEDMELLARTVYGEARGESFEGQVAVAAVIVNRMEHPEFPDEVEKIIYEPLAFTAVADGQINLGYDEQAYEAVKAALAGQDPSGGALYYYNPEKSTSKWIWSRQVIKRIGKHTFAI